MVDKIYSCPANTRCACFDGPACPSSLYNPCQPYKLPPPVPAKFTLYYNGKRTDCSPTGCNDTHFSGRELQTLIEQKKKRDDSYDDYWSSYFYLPGNGSDLLCYNGTVAIGPHLCEQWIWKTGGYKAGQPTTTTSYYIYYINQTNVDQKRYAAVSGDDARPFVPVMYEIFYNSGPVCKTSSHLIWFLTSLPF